MIKSLKIFNLSIYDIEFEMTKFSQIDRLKKPKLLFFELIMPKILHILDNFNYNLQVDIRNDDFVIYSKSFVMNKNLKLIKLIDFDQFLNPKLENLLSKNDKEYEIDDKKIYFSKINFVNLEKNLYKFNSILSLIEYETSKDYIDNPCYLNGYFTENPKIMGSGNYEKCYQLIIQIINKLQIEKNHDFGILNNKNLSSVIIFF